VIVDIVGKTALSVHDNFPASDQSLSGASPLYSLSFDKTTGWIVAQDTGHNNEQKITQLCWLPVELRGYKFDAHGSMFVIASDFNHQLTIIDFEPMLIMLRQLGVIS
jgi:hypothetical protein